MINAFLILITTKKIVKQFDSITFIKKKYIHVKMERLTATSGDEVPQPRVNITEPQKKKK